ncbi:MAG: hypothetical protein ACI4VR_05460 [Bacilli bacterium]
MRNKKKLCFLMLCIFSFFTCLSFVSAKTITVHYYESVRKPTYDWIKTYLGGTHAVFGYNAIGNASVETQLNNSAIFVVHNHGGPGRQSLSGTSSNGICGTNGDGTTWKSLDSMTVNFGKPLYIAIYYGCSTGVTTSAYGNIMTATTNKKAKSAVAWNVNTYVNDVNIWNMYFFDKARTYNATGLNALTYADTSLAADSGAINALIMKNNRVTAGTFGWTFSSVLFQ